MAELRKAILGVVSGALGDIVFRERHGLNYLATRPSSFIPGNDPASIARRARFALTVKTSASINRIPELKMLWAAAYSNGLSQFSYIFKSTYKYVTAAQINDTLTIVPDNGFGTIFSAGVLDRTRVRLVIEAIGDNAGINIVNEPDIMMACLLFLSNPVDESADPYSIMSFVSPEMSTDLTQQLTFDANLTSQQQVVFDKYTDKKAFVALTTLNAEGLPVHYSATILIS